MTRTPAARSPSSRVRSSAKRKITKTVVANRAIAGTDRRVRSSTLRSLARIATYALIAASSSELEDGVGPGLDALALVADDDAGSPARREQLSDRFPDAGIEVCLGLVQEQ